MGAPGSVFRSGTIFSENMKFLVFHDFPLYFPLYSIKGGARRDPDGGIWTNWSARHEGKIKFGFSLRSGE